MTNQNLPATTNDIDYDLFVKAGQAMTGSNIIGHLLRFTKYGEYKAGQDGVILPTGTLLIAHVLEAVTGWQKWQDNKPTDQVMVMVWDIVRGIAKVPKREELGDLDHQQWEIDSEGKERDPWQLTAMLILKGHDDDELYTFSTSSWGGRAVVGKLVQDFGYKGRMHPGMLPVIKLGWKDKTHSDKQIGDYRVPVFTIMDWADRAIFDKALGEAKDDGDEGGVDSVEQLPLDPPLKATPPPEKKKTGTRF